MKAPAFLPQGYKNRIRWTRKGVAKTGQVSPKGWVAQGDHWDGRESAKAAPAPHEEKLKDYFQRRNIPWVVHELPNGEKICLPKEVADNQDPSELWLVKEIQNG